MIEIAILQFVFTAILGGLAYIFLWAKTWDDLKDFENLRHVVLSAIAGYIYYFLHSDYNFPNSVIVFVVGYFAPDFLQGILERFRH